MFFNRPVRVAPAKFVRGERRYAALGRSSGGRLLTVVFTIRDTLIRPISVRDMSRRERRLNERRKKNRLPRFRSEDEEREFWAEHDVVDYFDWDKAAAGAFPAVKPSTTTISVRLPEAMLEELKALANERDVPYQSLLKMFLAERIARERQARRKVRG